VPQTKAQVVTDLQSALLNPMANQAATGGHNASIQLTFDSGRNPDLDGLVSAIETFYGAGKISGEADTTARSVIRLRVIA
jgi:hypothetical protein